MKYFIFTLLLGSTANAQANCAPYEIVTERLESKYKEVRQSVGISANGTLVETWANIERGNWSVIVVQASGVACLVASGSDFILVEQESQGEDL